MSDRERISAMWRYYRQAKELLDRESEDYDPDTAVDLLIDSAKLGCDVAKYRLGKMFLRGEDVTKNTDYALRWLEDARRKPQHLLYDLADHSAAIPRDTK